MYLYLLVWWQDVAHLCLVEDASLSSCVVARCCSLMSSWRCIFIFLCGGKMLLTCVWLKMYLYLLVWWQDVAHLCLVEDASLSSCVVARCCSLMSSWRCIFIFLCVGKMLLTCVWLKMHLYLLVWWQDVAHLCLVEDVSLSSCVVARCCSLVSGWRCIFIFLCGGKMLLTCVWLKMHLYLLVWWQDVAHLCLVEDASLSSCVVARCCSLVSGWRCIFILCGGKMLLTCVWLKMYLYLVWWQDVAHLCLVEDVSLSSCVVARCCSLVSGWRCIFIFLCGGKMLLTCVWLKMYLYLVCGKMLLTCVWLKMYLYLLVWWQDVAHLCLVEDASLSSCVVARCCSLVSGWRCIFILCGGKMLLTCVWLKMYLYLLVWWQDVAHLCLVEDVSLSSCVVARCCSLVSGWRCIFILCGGKMLLTCVWLKMYLYLV